MIRRISFLLTVGIVAALACSDGDSSGPVHSYSVEFQGPPTIAIGQDSTYNLVLDSVRVNGVFSRTSLDVRRDDDQLITRPLVVYSTENPDVAVVSPSGIVTAVGGGTTNIVATFRGSTVAVPILVRGYPTTFVDLTTASPTPFYALPGHAASSRLAATVKVGDATVFCNFPVCANTATRANQRVVRFVSLDTAKATIENGSSTTTLKNARGQITAKDTGTARFVLEVPGDGVADTLTLNLELRPIDSMEVSVDSIIDVVANSTQPSRFYTQALVPRGATLLLKVTFRARVPGVTPAQYITVTRPRYPIVTWQTASNVFAAVTADGRFTGLTAVGTAPTCTNLNPQSVQIAVGFQPPGTVPTNCPAPAPVTIPTRPVSCVRPIASQGGDAAANCTVYVLARATDPKSGKALSFYLPIVIQNR